MSDLLALEKRIRVLEDIESIRRLKHRYFAACDGKRPADVLACFAPGEVALDYGRVGVYTRENVRQRLNMRDFLDTMRASGVHTGGPPALDQRDRQAFANSLDRFIARAGK